MFRRIRRTVVALTGATLLTTALLGTVTVGAASATGQANWQITFAGTLTNGSGFWGWCDLSGGTTFDNSGLATSGTSGDCAYAEYYHPAGGSSQLKCNQNVTITGWYEGTSVYFPPEIDWFASGTSVTHPASETAFCGSGALLGTFPSQFNNLDTALPVLVGHANLGAGVPGILEYQITETPAR